MKTKFPYGKIDYRKYFDAYMEREDAIRTLPTEAEQREAARKTLIRDRCVLAPVPPDETAREGDSLTLSVVSELPKFNKPKVRVTLGRGLYDSALEAALVGTKAGESRHVAIREKDVTATVVEIARKQIPAPTDEMVRALEMTDFHNKPLTTVAEFEAFFIEQDTEGKLATVEGMIADAIVADYPLTEYDGEDLRVMRRLEAEWYASYYRDSEGVDVSALTREESQKMFGCDSFEAFLDQLDEFLRQKLHYCLIALNILGIPCEGEVDPLENNDAMVVLMDKMRDMVKRMMAERDKKA